MAVTAPGFTVAGATAQAGDNKETETGKGSTAAEKYSDVSVLTGEPIDPTLAAQRPIAVMFPIDKEAQPQYGLSNVDVFYEIIEEGSMSRQMGIITTADRSTTLRTSSPEKTSITSTALAVSSVLITAASTEFPPAAGRSTLLTLTRSTSKKPSGKRASRRSTEELTTTRSTSPSRRSATRSSSMVIL